MRLPVAVAFVMAAAVAAFLWRPQEESAIPPNSSGPVTPPAPVTPESLAAEVEAVRGLKFRRPLRFVRVGELELQKKVRAAMRVAVPPAESAVRIRAALALALIRPGQEFDAADCLAGSAMEVPAAHYDAGTATLWVNDAFSPDTRPDLTARLVVQLARTLLLQHSDIAPALPEGNDDALLTAYSILQADAMVTAQRHAEKHAGRVSSAAAVPEPSTYHASPPFLRAILAFPSSVPSIFHAPLRQRESLSDSNELLNRILSRPPRTSVELLHPDTWPAKLAAPIQFDRASFSRLRVLTENSLGEFGIRTLFKTQLNSSEAEDAAAGLLADRYVLFEGGGPGADHLVWRSRWASAADAGAFLRALGATHLGNAGMAPAAGHFSESDRFTAKTPSLTLAAVRRECTVTFVASPDAEARAALLAGE